MSKSDETEKMAEVLEVAGREYGKHSGVHSDERERRTFSRDLRTAALRYARAYYAEARELGLIPEYERTAPATAAQRWSGPVDQRCWHCGARFEEHIGDTDDCPQPRVAE